MIEETNTCNFAAVQTNLNMADELTKLKDELAHARGNGVMDERSVESAIKEVTWAIKEAIMPVPSKAALLDHLDNARDSLSGNPHTSEFTSHLEAAAAALQNLP